MNEKSKEEQAFDLILELRTSGIFDYDLIKSMLQTLWQGKKKVPPKPASPKKIEPTGEKVEIVCSNENCPHDNPQLLDKKEVKHLRDGRPFCCANCKAATYSREKYSKSRGGWSKHEKRLKGTTTKGTLALDQAYCQYKDCPEKGKSFKKEDMIVVEDGRRKLYFHSESCRSFFLQERENNEKDE